MVRVGGENDFARYLESVRSTYKAQRNFVELLDRAKVDVIGKPTGANAGRSLPLAIQDIRVNYVETLRDETSKVLVPSRNKIKILDGRGATREVDRAETLHQRRALLRRRTA